MRTRNGFAVSGFALAALACAAIAGPIEVIYTELAGSPTAQVPNAKDPNGTIVPAEFSVLWYIAVREDGGDWVLKATTTQDPNWNGVLIRGAGKIGNNFCQESQPLQGRTDLTEQYDFFDNENLASWNASGWLGMSLRAKGGSTVDNEKIIVVDPNGGHTIVLQQGSPLTGLLDTTISGDELLGNSVGSVQILNDGTVFYGVTPITNCNSSRYPALLKNAAAYKQSGVTLVNTGTGTETLKGLNYDGADSSTDGLHYVMKATMPGGTLGVDALVADDQLYARKDTPLGGTGWTTYSVANVTHMLSDGTWFARGEAYNPADPNSTNRPDWIMRNGAVVVKTGDLITTTASERWGYTISWMTGNIYGDSVVTGVTDNPDTTVNEVMVLNGTEILAREGDPIDVNGNGLFDDDVYLAGFKGAGTVELPTDGYVYFLANLRNGAGGNLGEGFLRIRLPSAVRKGDMNCDGVVDFKDINPFVAILSGTAPCNAANADTNCDSVIDFKDINPFVALLSGGTPCAN
jgi:hypothetical protein